MKGGERGEMVKGEFRRGRPGKKESHPKNMRERER